MTDSSYMARKHKSTIMHNMQERVAYLVSRLAEKELLTVHTPVHSYALVHAAVSDDGHLHIHVTPRQGE